MNDFCDSFEYMQTRYDLANCLNIPLKKLTYYLYFANLDNYYINFEIPKKSGKNRHISAPTNGLKYIQQELARKLYNYQEFYRMRDNIRSNISHGFERHKNIISNAEIHRHKKFIINFDLENFFDNFHFGRVQGFFEKNKYFQCSREVSIAIAQLCCYKGKLPQGSPCSPIITNLICQVLDMHLLKIAKKFKLDYTRYADDLTFSTNKSDFIEYKDQFYDSVEKAIKKAGFKININKTRLQYNDSRQSVTGLVVNKKINVTRDYYKKVRAMANELYKTGEYSINGIPGTLNQLQGMFSFIKQIDDYNHKIDKTGINFRQLSGREKQFQKFLFYKFFIDNKMPIIVTEGKTDPKYITAAVKNLCFKYPQLIKQNKRGDYKLKFCFLHRTHLLEELFGMSAYGGDAIKNLYNYFSDGGKNISDNYLSIFTKKYDRQPNFPVIFIFDNELTTGKKPLANFCKYAKLTEEQKMILSTNLFCNIVGNLYVVTNPLDSEKTESEIEDLFLEDTLNTKIQGRKFSRDPKADMKKFYNKDIFSNWVNENYDTIDFTKFEPLLNAIVEVINTYTETRKT